MDLESVRPFVGPKLVAVLALGLLATATVAGSGGVRELWRPARWIGSAHVAVFSLACLWSIVPLASVSGDYFRGMGLITRLAAVAIAVAAATTVAASPDRAVTLLRFVLATCFVVALYAVVQAVGLDPIIDPSWLEQTNRSGITETRVVSTLGHANFVGQFLLFGTGAAAGLVCVETHRLTRAVVACAGAVIAAGIVVSGARGAWVGLVVQIALAGGVVAWWNRRKSLRLHGFGIAVSAVALAAAIGVALALSPAGKHIAERARAFRTDAMTGSSRTILWRDSIRMVPAYAATGCGPEAFVRAFLPYISAELERAEPYALFDSAHNIPLDTLICTGAVGLLVWLALVSLCLVAQLRGFTPATPGDGSRPGVALAVGVGLAGYLAHGLFVFETIAPTMYFYVFLAIAVGLKSAVAGDPLEMREPQPGRYWIAVAVVIASIVAAGPRLRLVLLADRQMQTSLVLAADGRLADAVAAGRASVSNAEALGPAPELRHLLARTCARAGDASRAPSADEAALLTEAADDLEAALRWSNTPQLLHAERADIALRFGDTDRAVSELRTALEIAPAFWPARERLASLLLASGDREDARREATIALDFNPESVVARTVLNRLQVAE